MNLFFVALDDDNPPDKVKNLVSEHYEHTNYQLSQLTWVIGSDATNPGEICRNLGINKTESQPATGVVALIGDYSGYADKNLWDLMSRWSAS